MAGVVAVVAEIVAALLVVASTATATKKTLVTTKNRATVIIFFILRCLVCYISILTQTTPTDDSVWGYLRPPMKKLHLPRDLYPDKSQAFGHNVQESSRESDAIWRKWFVVAKYRIARIEAVE